MDSLLAYISIAVFLVIAELVYFRIADKCNIIDKPNERSSHKTIVLRGGGIIFTIGLWIWSIMFGFHYPWLLAGVTLAAGISFVDDIHSLPDYGRVFTSNADTDNIGESKYGFRGRILLDSCHYRSVSIQLV